jgi:hypothetical protein
MKRSQLAIGLAISLAAASSCGDVNTALARLSEARHAAADLQVDFTRAADAANRAVMADTDDASVKYAAEARREDGARIGAVVGRGAGRRILDP